MSGFEMTAMLQTLANATHEIQAMEDHDGAGFAFHQAVYEMNRVTARFHQHTVIDGKTVD